MQRELHGLPPPPPPPNFENFNLGWTCVGLHLIKTNHCHYYYMPYGLFCGRERITGSGVIKVNREFQVVTTGTYTGSMCITLETGLFSAAMLLLQVFLPVSSRVEGIHAFTQTGEKSRDSHLMY